MNDNDKSPTQDTEHHLREPETLAKVLPAGGPLVSTWWACSRCGYQQRGGPPLSCMFNAEPADCPVERAA